MCPVVGASTWTTNVILVTLTSLHQRKTLEAAHHRHPIVPDTDTYFCPHPRVQLVKPSSTGFILQLKRASPPSNGEMSPSTDKGREVSLGQGPSRNEAFKYLY